jgi:hypothetical protein
MMSYQHEYDVSKEFTISHILNVKVYSALVMQKLLGKFFRNAKQEIMKDPEDFLWVPLNQTKSP